MRPLCFSRRLELQDSVQGTGSVNGTSGYDFRVTAYDGQVNGGGGIDKFRIKITRTGGPNAVVSGLFFDR